MEATFCEETDVIGTAKRFIKVTSPNIRREQVSLENLGGFDDSLLRAESVEVSGPWKEIRYVQ